MKVVKKESATKKLKGLLFSKNMLEHQMRVSKIGADTACAYMDAIDTKVKALESFGDPKGLEFTKLKYEYVQVKKKASDHISDLKEFQRFYEGQKSELESFLEKNKFSELDFNDTKKEAEELSKYELWGQVVITAPNVELPKVISDIEKELEYLRECKESIEMELKKEGLQIALIKTRLERELFELSIHEQTLTKRLNNRKEYHVNQFLPQYNKDMEECDKNLDRYMEIAKMIAEKGVDFQIKIMLDQHEKHKDEKENLWLFYTALRSRLGDVAKHVKRNQSKFPEVYNVMKEFLN